LRQPLKNQLEQVPRASKKPFGKVEPVLDLHPPLKKKPGRKTEGERRIGAYKHIKASLKKNQGRTLNITRACREKEENKKRETSQ